MPDPIILIPARMGREKLEQLRALEAGMRIDAVVLDHVPFGVDTPESLDRACAVIARRTA